MTSSGIGIQLNDRADAYYEQPFTSRSKPSSIMNMITREVCEGCNNGWMSRLETEARPIIERLHACAATPGDRLELDPIRASALARWIQKTAIAAELSSGGHFGGSEERGVVMMGSPLARSLVWLGHHMSYQGVAAAKAQIGISDHQVPRPGDEVSKASLFIVSLQQLAIAVYLRPGQRPEVPPMPVSEWVRIWPVPPTMEYPPIADVNDRTLDRLFGHEREWLPPLDVAPFKASAKFAVPTNVT